MNKNLNLSNRLLTIASFVNKGDKIADVGADHALLSVYLYINNISNEIIISDIGDGPLNSAKENAKGLNVDFRLGDGLQVLDEAEVDTVVISGMGGRLISEILDFDPKKTKSFKRFILEPENAEDKLREYLFDNGFKITNEKLARDDKRIYQVMVAVPDLLEILDEESRKITKQSLYENMAFEISPMLILNKDPLLEDLIVRKINLEKDILAETEAADSENSRKRAELARKRLSKLKMLVKSLF